MIENSLTETEQRLREYPINAFIDITKATATYLREFRHNEAAALLEMAVEEMNRAT
jgi:hypothetical protein